MSKSSTVRLGDVATYVNGYAFKPSDWSDSGLPIIRIQNLTGNDYETNYYSGTYDKKYEVVNGDVLISWSASLGVYVWDKGTALLNQHIFKVVFDKLEVDKRYFVHTISFLLDDMVKETHGSTMKHITKPRFDNTPFPYPTLEEQRKIAANLDKATHLIDLCNAILEKLDLLVKARFVEMFGTMPANEKQWNVGTIRDVVSEVRYGSSRKAADGNSGQYPYLRMNNITYSGELDLTDTKTIDIPEEELPKCTVRRGDVLFNRTNSKELVGKTCVYNRDEMMVLAGFVVRVRVNSKVLPEFLSAFLNTKFSKEMLLGMCKAAIGQANINAQELQNIAIYIPPIELQEQYVAFVARTDKTKAAVQQVLQKAETLKKALMQEYFG